MRKNCVFNNTVICSDCGDCYACDLNSSKRCDNCGKCLELEGYDLKAINIDDILDSQNDLRDFEELDDLHNRSNDELNEGQEFWDYIDDVVDLKDLMNTEEDSNLYEEFPGLLVYKKAVNKKEEEGLE